VRAERSLNKRSGSSALTPLRRQPNMASTTKAHGMLTPRTYARSAARYSVILFSILFSTIICAQKLKDLKPQGYVNDFANVLSASAKQKLTALCAEVDSKAGAQIAIVTVPSLEGQEIEDYSIGLATQWGIGPKDKSRGVLILFAPTEHKYRFEVGYGLEGILPDGKVGGFGREAVPLLRQNNYDAAVLLMTQRVAGVIAADKGVTLDTLSGVPPPPAVSNQSSAHSGLTFQEIFFGIFLLFFIFRLIFGRSNYGRRGGGGWWIGPMIGGSMGGGSWGGGGSGGGGFGGFGGGSFGGGGASGSW
jgi:uncharacterized protein